MVVDHKGNIYALKSIEKRSLLDNEKLKDKKIKQLFNEKNVHLSLRNRFCISVYVRIVPQQCSFFFCDRFATFQQEKCVNFLLEFAAAGDLQSLIERTELSLEQKRYFFASASMLTNIFSCV